MKHNDKFLGMIPVLSSQAGLSLSTASWLEANTHIAAYALDSLLMKPGIKCLSTLDDLSSYVAWSRPLVLNASIGSRNANGLYTVRSHYDGQISRYTVEDILALISRLKPAFAILPKSMLEKNEALLQSLPDTIFPFIPEADFPLPFKLTRPHGVYLSYDKKTSTPEEMLSILTNYQGMPCYIAGDLDLPLMRLMLNQGVSYMESNRPAADALLGHVYCSEGVLSLDNHEYSMQFDVIDATCQCPTCSQVLTRAYLHHLLEHTPLLCQRFLVQHNIHYCQQMLFLGLNNRIVR